MTTHFCKLNCSSWLMCWRKDRQNRWVLQCFVKGSDQGCCWEKLRALTPLAREDQILPLCFFELYLALIFLAITCAGILRSCRFRTLRLNNSKKVQLKCNNLPGIKCRTTLKEVYSVTEQTCEKLLFWKKRLLLEGMISFGLFWILLRRKAKH